MSRKQSVTTRIHQPPAPPCWYKTIFWVSFLAWVGLQSAAEFYTIELLRTYTHLPLFDNEQQVDSAFLNIVATGILTVLLVICFIFGIVIVHKKLVIASAAFLSTLLILNVLAVGVLMSSQFGLATGPKKLGHRVLTIYHRNVSEHYWRGEMAGWAARFPLSSEGTAPAENVTESPARLLRPPRQADNATADDDDGKDYTVWQAERDALSLLSFFQWWGFCCGVRSVDDYRARGAQTPPSCRCLEKPNRPPCSATAHRLADGRMAAVWARGCLHVTGHFQTKLFLLRDLLSATIVMQFVVMMLGVIMGLNMPDSLSDDDEADSEGGDY